MKVRSKGKSSPRLSGERRAASGGARRSVRPRPDSAPDQEPTRRRLDAILRALPPEEFAALVERVGIHLDPKKRIDLAAQAARALVRQPDVREPGRLPAASTGLLYRIADAGGVLLVSAVPVGLDELVRRGIVYARIDDAGIELLLPTAFLVQLKSWEGEDPRALRALLSEASFETASAIAGHYLERPATPPLALSLEPAWETLGDPDKLEAQIASASHEERRLLDAIEQVGGEVDSQELMDLEREPLRLRGAYGVAAGRRGAAFSLEKRGLLFPVHPNRHVLPTEVAAIVGAKRQRERERRREQIRLEVAELDHLPRRARFSLPAAPVAVAMAVTVRDGATEVRPDVGTPRSLVTRLATRFGREHDAAAMLVALSRAVALWSEQALSSTTPPGCWTLDELERELFVSWRRGGAWDEARPDGETLRVAPEHRDASPAGVVREMVLDALRVLGHSQWVRYDSLEAYLLEDPRVTGLERLLQRWAARTSVSAPSVADIVARVVGRSLPTLGVVDLGGPDQQVVGSPEADRDLAVRLTARGKALLSGRGSERPPGSSEFVEPRLMRVGSDARVGDVLALGPLAEIAAVDPYLELSLSSGSLAAALAAGLSPDEMRARIEAVAPLSDELDQTLEQAGTIVGHASLAPCSGFLWVEDEEVRRMLQTRAPCAELFVDPSPPAGLLVAPSVDPERLVRRCRALGVDVEVEEGVFRVRRSTRPPPRTTQTTKRSMSWRPPAVLGGTDHKGRRSG